MTNSSPSVGLDIGKKTIFVAALNSGCKPKKLSFANDDIGHQKLSSWLQQAGFSDAKICLESTGFYGLKLADHLYEAGLAVYVVNPLRIKSFAQSKLSRNKTDNADAVIIAQFIALNDARPYKPLTTQQYELRYLRRGMDDLIAEAAKCKIKLEHRDLLPLPVVQSWENLLDTINSQIAALQAEINQLIKHDAQLRQDYHNLQTIPGIGAVTATYFLAEITNIDDFASPRHLAAFIGVNPRRKQSGTAESPSSMSKIGSRQIRKALFFPAMTAKTYNPIVRDFCNNLQLKGKKKMVVIGAAMRKLVHIIYAVLKHRTPFDPEYRGNKITAIT